MSDQPVQPKNPVISTPNPFIKSAETASLNNAAIDSSIGLAIAGFVLGLLAVILSCAVIGVLLGILGLILSIVYYQKQSLLKSLACWGIGLSITGILAGILFAVLYIAAIIAGQDFQDAINAVETGNFEYYQEPAPKSQT